MKKKTCKPRPAVSKETIDEDGENYDAWLRGYREEHGLSDSHPLYLLTDIGRRDPHTGKLEGDDYLIVDPIRSW